MVKIFQPIQGIIDYRTFYNKSGLVILVDFAKVFDSLTWSFSDSDKSSQFFNLHCGIRQGYSLSALLFIIVVEYLSTDIQGNKMIKCITIGDHEYLIIIINLLMTLLSLLIVKTLLLML